MDKLPTELKLSGGIRSELMWEPPSQIAKTWRFLKGKNELKCNFCDYTMTWDLPPIEQEMKYRPVDRWSNEVVGYFVDKDPGEAYYEKRLRLNKMKQTHWDTVHSSLPDDWREQWTDNDGMIYCDKCGYMAQYSTHWDNESKKFILDREKKYHRRVCDPSKLRYSM